MSQPPSGATLDNTTRKDTAETGRPYHEAPRDGRSILILDVNQAGRQHSTSVFYYRYSDADRAEHGISEDGLWCYTDDLLNDAAPMGPKTPFRWLPDPFADATGQG
ncbi:hypothetical protein AB9K35_04280 [Leisingera sp. XS_AS12]